MIIIQKEKYTLRTWEKSDASSLAEQISNKQIWDNCRDSLPYPYYPEDAEFILKVFTEKEGIHDFCIEVDGKAAGSIGFAPETDVQRFNAEVGYWIGKKYWNQGIVTDALQEAIRYYFTHNPIVRVFAFVFDYNQPSMRVLEKVGFNKVGVMHQAIYKNEAFHNAHYYELLKSNMMTDIVACAEDDYDELLYLWETSVRSTHHFLTEADILFYRPLVRNQYFSAVDLYAIRNQHQIVAFIGLSHDLIEMLFVHPQKQNKGYGKRLIKYAIQHHHIEKVDVNEQNDQALQFYLKQGFDIIGRDSVDGLGKPFPILHMQLRKQ